MLQWTWEYRYLSETLISLPLGIYPEVRILDQFLIFQRISSLFLIVAIVVWLLSYVWPFATPWAAAHQASLSFTISQNLLKLMSIESVMPSNHLIFCHPFSSCLLSFSASGSFPMSWLFALGSQSIGASASAPVLAMNIQDWFPSGLTGLISLQGTLKSLLQHHISKVAVPIHTPTNNV